MKPDHLTEVFFEDKELYMEHIISLAKTGLKFFGYGEFANPMFVISRDKEMTNGTVIKDANGDFMFGFPKKVKDPVCFTYIFDSYTITGTGEEQKQDVEDLDMSLGDIFLGKAGLEYAKMVTESLIVTTLTEDEVLWAVLPYKHSQQDGFEYKDAITGRSERDTNTVFTFDELKGILCA